MFKKYKGSKFAIALNSGTAVLYLSLIAISIKHEDEVILPTMAFAATVNSVIHAGGIPIFVDLYKEVFQLLKSNFFQKGYKNI